METKKRRRFNLPLMLTLGGMIILGIITTTLGFLLWPDLEPRLDTSNEGWANPTVSAEDAGPTYHPGAKPTHRGQ